MAGKRKKVDESEEEEEAVTSQEESEEEKPAKKKKAAPKEKKAAKAEKPAAKKTKKADKEEESKEPEHHVEIGPRKRCTVRKFKGKVLIDIREYYEKDGESLPGKKGVALSAEEWKKLLENAEEISGWVDNA
ncbi:PC4-domain-containing protein [Exidia glandulosa HHB12029]|uniref:PC4-domain-containing protein n=1 Tax=Exidia glandulosa HHB12029 TaxID=1314781 RepID=A0A165JP50_EXIGL|nr:PC4-domain-containing protein [Exidia glandulosa HHB12029]